MLITSIWMGEEVLRSLADCILYVAGSLENH